MADTILQAATYTALGTPRDQVRLPAEVFDGVVNMPVMHRVVMAYRANQREGNAATKTRGLVVGGNQKPWRQKGTGRARAGTTRAPQWTGGGVAFAPTPRSFDVKVNRKVRRAAFRAALSDHAGRGTLAVLDAGGFSEPSTKTAAALLAAWGADLPLLVIAQPEEEALVRSFRNLPRSLVLEPSELEVGAIVWARSVLATEGALERVSEAMSK